jgi:hypothetical protein
VGLVTNREKVVIFVGVGNQEIIDRATTFYLDGYTNVFISES